MKIEMKPKYIDIKELEFMRLYVGQDENHKRFFIFKGVDDVKYIIQNWTNETKGICVLTYSEVSDFKIIGKVDDVDFVNVEVRE